MTLRIRLSLVVIAVVLIGLLAWQTIQVREFRRQLAIAEQFRIYWIELAPLVPRTLAPYLPSTCREWKASVVEGIGLIEGTPDNVRQLREFSNLKHLGLYDTPVTTKDLAELMQECELELVRVDRLSGMDIDVAALQSQYPDLRLEMLDQDEVLSVSSPDSLSVRDC